MAYGDKYYGSFKDYYDRTVLITIYEKDYSGTSSEMKLAGANIEYNGSDQNLYEPIMSSTLNVDIVSETDFQYIELYTADAKKYKVIVTIDSDTHWIGFLIPDLFSEPYTCAPYITRIVATDGLKSLESIDWYVKGVYSQASVISFCLNQIELGRDIIEAINVYEENHNVTNNDSAINQTFIDCDIYKGLTFYEALEDILNLYGARIYQKAGQWWMVCIYEFKDEILYRPWWGHTVPTAAAYYNPELLIGYSKDDKLANVDQYLNILPGWKKFTIQMNLGKKESFIENWKFEDWTIIGYETTTTPRGTQEWPIYKLDDWSIQADIEKATNRRPPSKQSGSYVYSRRRGEGLSVYRATIVPISNTTPLYFNENNSSPSKHISQSFQGIVAGEQSFRFELGYAITGTTDSCQFWIKIMMATGPIIDPSSVRYYLTSDGSWSETEAYINIENIAGGGDSFNEQTYSIISEGIPCTGSLSVFCYASDKGRLNLTQFRGDLLTKSLSEFPDVWDYEKQINVNNNYIDDGFDLFTGDFPDMENTDTKNPSPDVKNEILVYLGGLFLDENKTSITKQWQTRTEIENSSFTDADQLHKIISKQKEGLTIPAWGINGSILGKNLQPDMTIVDYGVNNKKYLFSNGVFDLQSAQVNGTFIEVGSYSGADWILEDGTWNDDGIWIDDETWNDSDPTP